MEEWRGTIHAHLNSNCSNFILIGLYPNFDILSNLRYYVISVIDGRDIVIHRGYATCYVQEKKCTYIHPLF